MLRGRKFKVGEKVRLISACTGPGRGEVASTLRKRFQGTGVVVGRKCGMVVVRFPKRALFASWLLERA